MCNRCSLFVPQPSTLIISPSNALCPDTGKTINAAYRITRIFELVEEKLR
jgi:hypothetical protein